MPAFNKQDSSIVGASFAEEVSGTPKILAGTPNWYTIEPNTFNNFGGDFKNDARKFIVNDRQRRQGTVSDLDSGGGFNSDFTQTNFIRLMQGFFFANAREKPSTQPLNGTQYATSAVAGAGVYSTTAAGIIANHIVKASGFSNPQNNGFGVVTAATGGTSITLGAKATVVEAAPPSTAKIEAAGYQAVAGDLKIVANIAGQNTFQMTSTTLNFTTLGLNVGEWIYIGGDLAATQFLNAANTGYARIFAIAAGALTFDKSTFVPVADLGTAKTVQFFFGPSLRDEGAVPANIVRRTYNIERTLGLDGLNGNVTQAEYITGAVPNTFKFNIPTAEKLTADVDFVAMGYELRNGSLGIKTGNRFSAPGDPALSSSIDVYRARCYILDSTTLNPTSLFAYITKGDISITNNVAVNKGVGALGGFDATAGTFDISATQECYFSDVRAQAAIKANNTCTLDVIVADSNAGFVFDIPYLTIGGGRADVTVDKPITLPLTNDGYKGPNGYTALLQYFPYLPQAAMPIT